MDTCRLGAEEQSPGVAHGLGRISLTLTLGAGSLLMLALFLLWLTGRPGAVPPPPSVVARQNISIDCAWVGHATAWQDRNADGVRDATDPPLPEVRFEVDDVTHGRRNVADVVASGEDGSATLRQFLPGCPEVEFAVRAEAPVGFHSTTPQPIAADGNLSFGFKRTSGTRGQGPHNNRLQATAGG